MGSHNPKIINGDRSIGCFLLVLHFGKTQAETVKVQKNKRPVVKKEITASRMTGFFESNQKIVKVVMAFK